MCAGSLFCQELVAGPRPYQRLRYPGVSREILDFIERIRGKLPGATERARLAPPQLTISTGMPLESSSFAICSFRTLTGSDPHLPPEAAGLHDEVNNTRHCPERPKTHGQWRDAQPDVEADSESEHWAS
jgi:hypothetical protein